MRHYDEDVRPPEAGCGQQDVEQHLRRAQQVHAEVGSFNHLQFGAIENQPNRTRSNAKKTTIEVQGAAITILSQKEQDFICLTDIARFKSDDRFDDLIRYWLRNRNTVEFLGVCERLNNLNCNPVEFDGIRIPAGLNLP